MSQNGLKQTFSRFLQSSQFDQSSRSVSQVHYLFFHVSRFPALHQFSSSLVSNYLVFQLSSFLVFSFVVFQISSFLVFQFSSFLVFQFSSFPGFKTGGPIQSACWTTFFCYSDKREADYSFSPSNPLFYKLGDS